METLANGFALLADQEGDASALIALKTAEEKKKNETAKNKNKAKKNKNKKSSVRGQEGQKSLGSNAKANTGDGQANGRAYGRMTSNEVARSPTDEAERKERWIAKEKERQKELAMKTLKEYEAHKAKILSVPEVTLDKDLVVSKKKKDRKLRKATTMSLEEFNNLPVTESEGQDSPGKGTGEDSGKYTIVGGSQRGWGASTMSFEELKKLPTGSFLGCLKRVDS